MKLASMLLLHLFIDLCKSQCGPQVNQNPMFNNAFDGIDLVDNCDFSAKKFNASCLSASCSQLLAPGLCPYTSTGNLNLSALSATLSILNSCFRRQTTICDTPLNNMDIPQFSIGLTQVFSGLGGYCTNAPNNGVFTNVQDVTFSLSPDQSPTSGPLNIVINAPVITLAAIGQCTLTLANIPFTFPNVNVTLHINITPTASIDFQDDQPNVQVQADNCIMSLDLGNFIAVNSPIQLPALIDYLFNTGVTNLWKTSGNPTAIATFYATFVAFGIEATKQNC